MYPALIFHSFNNNINCDKFYDLKITEFVSLIDFLSNHVDAKELTLTFDDGYKSILPAVEEALKREYKVIAYIVTDYVDKDGFLTKKDLKYLIKIGCKIGSHTKSHKDLTQVKEKELTKELTESKKFLENILGMDVDHFSFPYGKHNNHLINIVKKIYRSNAISKPNFFRKKGVLGRVSITSLNCKNHEKILNIIINKFNLRYIIKLLIISSIKKVLPINIYYFLKNMISKNKSKDVFKDKYY